MTKKLRALVFALARVVLGWALALGCVAQGVRLYYPANLGADASAAWPNVLISRLQNFQQANAALGLAALPYGRPQQAWRSATLHKGGTHCMVLSAALARQWARQGRLQEMTAQDLAAAEIAAARLFAFARSLRDESGRWFGLWWAADPLLLYRDASRITQAPQTWQQWRDAAQSVSALGAAPLGALPSQAEDETADGEPVQILRAPARMAWEDWQTLLDETAPRRYAMLLPWADEGLGGVLGDEAIPSQLWLSLFASQGGELLDRSGRPILGMAQQRERALRVWNWVAQWARDGLSPHAGFAPLGERESLGAALNARASMIAARFSAWPRLRKQRGEQQWDFSPLPAPEEGQPSVSIVRGFALVALAAGAPKRTASDIAPCLQIWREVLLPLALEVDLLPTTPEALERADSPLLADSAARESLLGVLQNGQAMLPWEWEAEAPPASPLSPLSLLIRRVSREALSDHTSFAPSPWASSFERYWEWVSREYSRRQRGRAR